MCRFFLREMITVPLSELGVNARLTMLVHEPIV